VHANVQKAEAFVKKNFEATQKITALSSQLCSE
jgi:hypothetical protein